MLKTAVIAQISDMHINATNISIAQVSGMRTNATNTSEESYRNVDVRQNFINVLQTLKNEKIDLLVLSGDLAAVDGEIEAYQWLQQTLATFPYPYVVMAGNHDRVSVMTQVFDIPTKNIHEDMLYFSRRINGHRLLFLDTSSYTLPQKQLVWLYQQLYDSDEPVLLFMHHPPLLCGCQFMDLSYPLRNIAETWAVLQQLSVVKHIFCGHYHTDKILNKEGKSIYLTPSTMLQIDTINPIFTIAHTQPGWRMIEWQGEELKTSVEYL